MKIGIIGLQPKQLDTLRQYQYSAEIVPYDKEAFTKASIIGFSRTVDKVVCLIGHMPRPVANYIPDDKCQPLYGAVGVSTIVRYLHEHYPPKETAIVGKTILKQPMQPVQASVPPVFVDVTAKYAEIETVQEKQRQALKDWRCSLLTGSVMHYRVDKAAVLIKKESGRTNNDYSLLNAAVEGDVLRYEIDTDKPEFTTRHNLQNQRKKYAMKLGRKIEVHIFRTHADFYVGGPLEPNEDGSGEILRHDLGSSVDWKQRQRALLGIDFATEAGAYKVPDKRPNHTDFTTVVKEDVHQVIDPLVKPFTQNELQHHIAEVNDEPGVTAVETASVTEEPVKKEVVLAPVVTRTPLSASEIEYWKSITVAVLGDGEEMDSAIEIGNDMIRALRKLQKEGL